MLMRHSNLRTLTVLALMLSVSVCSIAQKRYRVDGFTNGYEGRVLYMSYTDGRGRDIVDSCKVSNGTFRFEGTLDIDNALAFISTDKGVLNGDINKQTKFYLEPRTITVGINAYNHTMPVVMGSVQQAQEDEYNGLVMPETSVIKSVAVLAKGSTDMDFKYKLEASLKPIFQSYNAKTMDYIRRHPDVELSLFLLHGVANSIPADSAKALYDALSPGLKGMIQSEEIERTIALRLKTSTGKPAPIFTATDINGKPLCLGDFKGKYVVLDFWATWCGPCRYTNKHMKQLYEKYSGHDVEFIYVADDDRDPVKWRNIVEKDGIGMFRHVLRGANTSADINTMYAVKNIPAKFLIDKDGNMVGKFDTDELSDKLKSLLGF